MNQNAEDGTHFRGTDADPGAGDSDQALTEQLRAVAGPLAALPMPNGLAAPPDVVAPPDVAVASTGFAVALSEFHSRSQQKLRLVNDDHVESIADLRRTTDALDVSDPGHLHPSTGPRLAHSQQSAQGAMTTTRIRQPGNTS